jgi:putative endonuclease
MSRTMINNKSPSVYFMTNKNKTVLYTGVTSDLQGRVWEHKNCVDKNCFTFRCNAFLLIYYEDYGTMKDAIAREKQIKGWRRSKKNGLVVEFNPAWNDLAKEWVSL